MRDADINLYAFLVLKGWKLKELIHLTQIEKLMLHHARNQYYKEQKYLIAAAISLAFNGEEK